MDAFYVLLPAVVTLIVAAWTVIVLASRDRVLPIGEVGVSYAAAITLYTIIPLLGFVLNGLRFTDVNDFRSQWNRPGPSDVAEVAWLYCIHAASFATSYLLVRGTPPKPHSPPVLPGRRTFIAVAVFVALQAYLLGIRAVYGLSYDTYAEKLVLYERLPQLLMQVTAALSQVATTMAVAIVVLLSMQFRRHRLLVLLAVLAIVGPVLAEGTNRFPAVVVVLSAIYAYHLFVKPLSVTIATAASALVLVGFLALGFVRSGFAERGRELSSEPVFGATTAVTHANEFESCFSTSMDVYLRTRRGELADPPWQVYVSDLLAIVPKQFLPFEKLDSTKWYLDELYPGYSERNMGWGFGIIAEASIGFGTAEVVLKGIVIGALFAWLHRYLCRRRTVPWVWVVYVYVSVTAFRTLRSSSFELLRTLLFYVVPALVLVEFVASRFFGERNAAEQPARSAPSS